MASTKKFCVYMWTHVPSGKRYIGKGTEQRARAHLRLAWSRPDRSPKFYRAIRKHGPDTFRLGFIATGLDDSVALRVEAAFIAMYGTYNEIRALCEYNHTRGGDGPGGLRWTAEQRAGSKASHNLPGTVEKHRAATTKLWSEPEYREKLVASMNKPEAKTAAAIKTKGLWESAEYREKTLGARKSGQDARMAEAMVSFDGKKAACHARLLGVCPKRFVAALRVSGWVVTGTHKNTLWVRPGKKE